MRHAGFSLIELIAVIAVASVLAATAAPVLTRVDASRQHAVVTSVQETLAHARALALSTGFDSGVRFDTDNDVMVVVRLDPDGNLIELGGPRTHRFNADAAGIVSMDNGRGSDTLWFAPDGTPHARQADGTFEADFDSDCTITLHGGWTVVVEANSGRIRR